MNTAETIWIAVADAAKALFLQYNGPDEDLEIVSDGVLTHVNKPSRELVTNKRGRVFHSADGSRSAMEEPTDPHEHEKAVFANEISQYLQQHINKFDKVVLVAPPTMLGNIRATLSKTIKAKVSSEINKDLTHLPVKDLPKHLQKDMNFH